MKPSQHPAFEGVRLLAVVMLFLTLGTVVYHYVEHLNWLDAIYFAVVTATTVGYGDITPKTDAGKLFTIFYIFFMIILVSIFVNHVSRRRRKNGLFARFFSRPDKDD